MLRIRGLRTPLLDIPALDVAAGACVALMGPSGAGKSMLLRAIVDLDPNQGEVSLDGAAREAMSAEAWRRRVALAPAESGWWAETVSEHLEGDCADLIAALGLPPDCPGWRVSRLSSGERHRLSLVRALALSPTALLLDEPTARLDTEAAGLVEALIRARMEAGAPVLLATHDPELAARLGARVARIRDGRLECAAETVL